MDKASETVIKVGDMLDDTVRYLHVEHDAFHKRVEN